MQFGPGFFFIKKKGLEGGIYICMASVRVSNTFLKNETSGVSCKDFIYGTGIKVSSV